MSRPAHRLERTLLASVGAHLAVLGLLALIPWRAIPEANRVVSVRTVEFELVPSSTTRSEAREGAAESAVTEAPPSSAPSPSSVAVRAVSRGAPARSERAPEVRANAPTATGEGSRDGAGGDEGGDGPGNTARTTGDPPTRGPARTLDGAELLRSTRDDAQRIVASGAIDFGSLGNGHGPRDMVNRPRGTAEERLRENSAGYIQRAVAAGTRRHEAPGVRGYYWFLRRRMEEYWRPAVNNTPTLMDSVLATLAMPPEALREVIQSANGPMAVPGRAGGAADTLDAVHGVTRGNYLDSPGVTPFTGVVDASRGNVRRTRAEIEVLQDSDGRVTSIRVVRPSRVAGFDDAALEAVRAALPQQPPVAMPGGRRSRWSFEVVASRDPIMPGVGIEFDESTGWFELHWPGRPHVRTRVHLESAAPLGT